MNKRMMFLIFVMMVFYLSGCSQINKEDENVELVLAKGEKIFQKQCLQCHAISENGGNMNLLDETLLNRMQTQERMGNFIQKNMPANNPDTLSDDDVEALVQYLWDINLEHN